MAKKTKGAGTGGTLIDARERFARRAAQQDHLACAVANAFAKLEVLRQATLDVAALITSADDYEHAPGELLEAVNAIMSGPVGCAMIDAQDELEAAAAHG